MPDMQLENNTKRLRQACFKANYKKRKIMGMNMDLQSSSSCSNFNIGSSKNWEAYVDENDYYDHELYWTTMYL